MFVCCFRWTRPPVPRRRRGTDGRAEVGVSIGSVLELEKWHRKMSIYLSINHLLRKSDLTRSIGGRKKKRYLSLRSVQAGHRYKYMFQVPVGCWLGYLLFSYWMIERKKGEKKRESLHSLQTHIYAYIYIYIYMYRKWWPHYHHHHQQLHISSERNNHNHNKMNIRQLGSVRYIERIENEGG